MQAVRELRLLQQRHRQVDPDRDVMAALAPGGVGLEPIIEHLQEQLVLESVLLDGWYESAGQHAFARGAWPTGQHFGSNDAARAQGSFRLEPALYLSAVQSLVQG